MPDTPRPPQRIERGVRWLREEREGAANTALFALTVLLTAAAWLSLLGIPFYKRAKKVTNLIDAKDRFLKMAQKKCPPNGEFEIPLRRKTAAFNHVKQFAISDGVIWHRRHGEKEWEPLFFDGILENETPVQIDCDGANLIVIDDRNQVHYKKILRETEMNDKNLLFIQDKTEKDNWKEKWFALPILHHLSFLFMSKRLTLPSDARAVAISHRGHYNAYMEDRAGRLHRSGTGCTTLYVLEASGRKIRKYDPWSPLFAKISIPMPESETTSFEAINMSASASYLMLIGYESEKGSFSKTLKVYTKLSDIDTEGWNPMFQYDYWESKNEDALHILPIEPNWKEHILPRNAQLTDAISIHQTGMGNDARQIRIAGRWKGAEGYFWKSLKEKRWHFSRSIDLPDRKTLERSIRADPEAFYTTVHSYRGEGFMVDKKVSNLILSGFGENAFHSELAVGEETMHLHRRKGFLTFLGINDDFYELFIPEKAQAILPGPRTVPVRVKKEEDRVVIQTTRPPIRLALTRISPS